MGRFFVRRTFYDDLQAEWMALQDTVRDLSAKAAAEKASVLRWEQWAVAMEATVRQIDQENKLLRQERDALRANNATLSLQLEQLRLAVNKSQPPLNLTKEQASRFKHMSTQAIEKELARKEADD